MCREQILFVDDDEHYLELVRCIAGRAGVHARYASSGEEAVGILKEGIIGTLFTDLHMGGMNGYELAAIARKLVPHIDIVMVTSDTEARMPRIAVEAGIAKVIAKPDSACQLRGMLQGEGDTGVETAKDDYL